MVRRLTPQWAVDITALAGYTNGFPPQELQGAEKQQRQEEALRVLKYLTGQDFGYDVKAWTTFLIDNPDIIEERQARGDFPKFKEPFYDL